ncbi:MAG TPA: outer membrane beta-barrel protein [Devosia sp.]|nr:outer membrane beta-barrel protein [Devosia sp.]
MFRSVFGVGLLCLPLAAGTVADELEVSLYGGMNESSHTYGELSNGTNVQGGYFKWDGLSFNAPIYYGARVAYWPKSLANWGFALDFTHAKAYADLDQLGAGDSYSVLEFTDGLNLLTANALYKHDWDNGLRAYGGLGAGISLPHVEVTTKASTVVGASTTFEYQVTGPALQALAGASYEFADNWRVFGEYKLSHTINEARLTGGVGTFSTNITSHHLLAGISYAFDAGGF